ncbi:general substrate transporter [Aspergillus ambiguus]|uniref:general substrate transporter n=1 Tax=Aspergillus ambiguus TaxID=176160 RepID=UPI003CCD0FA0
MAKQEASVVKYFHAIRASPREIFNRHLILAVFAFALGGCAKGWDEGSTAAISELPSFNSKYNLNSTVLSNVVSLVNLGAGVGALLSFLLNDRVGRIWAMRIYQSTYIVGTLISCLSYGHVGALYVGRIVAGLGIGALTVVCPMAIAEIAPKTTRGLMTLWFNLCMLSSQAIGSFTVLGCSLHISDSRDLQYQTPWFVQTFPPAISLICSFFINESPRWLIINNQPQKSLLSLTNLRQLPQTDPYVETEFNGMITQIESRDSGLGNLRLIQIVKETFSIRSNLRRVQLTVMAYILAQMSGANAVTNYLPTIFGLIGIKGSSMQLTTSALYSIAKLIFCTAGSLFLVDVVGRRKSLLLGIAIQIICHSYIAGYLSFVIKDSSSVSKGASDGAIAMIYIHALGWAIGLYSLPYLFGAELWPNRIRSFGGALSQCFHWLFYFAITKATPSMLENSNQWGTFVLFDGFCVVAIIYTYFFVPETSGLSLEAIDKIFERPWYRLGQPLSQHDLSHVKNDEKWIEKA